MSARQLMRKVTTPILAVLLVVALIVGTVGGYFVASQLNNTQASQSAFLPYSDNYGGPIDDSQNGHVTSAPLVAGFSRGQVGYGEEDPEERDTRRHAGISCTEAHGRASHEAWVHWCISTGH